MDINKEKLSERILKTFKKSEDVGVTHFTGEIPPKPSPLNPIPVNKPTYDALEAENQGRKEQIQEMNREIIALQSRLAEAEKWRVVRETLDETNVRPLEALIAKQHTRLIEAESRLRAVSEILNRFPTIEQAATEKARELGIKVEWLAPDGMAETKYYELVEVWKNELDLALKGASRIQIKEITK